MSPRPPSSPPGVGPGWGAYCTTDNQSFWSGTFDQTAGAVAGVVQACPRLTEGPSPLEELLRLLLTRAGIELSGGAPVRG
jgi:hypothetical protein